MGAYFHQDFYESYGGVWETVDQFIHDAPNNAARVPDEVRQVLKRYDTDEQVEAFLDQVGCEYLAQPGDGGYRGWLTEIARRVESAKTI